ncbi:MAG: IclR family transcriptional regulator [Chloroflexota bacterium]|nr:IclR family transcriptional regulator [Chloroflexota bacterium]
MAGNSSVERALEILQYLSRHSGQHGVRSLAAALDLSPSTVFRLLETLEHAGFVQQNTLTEKYEIGVKAVQLGIAALGSLDLTAVAPARLRTLVSETGESAFLAVRDDTEVVYLLKEEGRYSIRTTALLGTRRPLHCTGLGKSFLATIPPAEAEEVLRRAGMAALTANTITDLGHLWEELALIRVRGYATDREEVEEGLACVAAPIRDYRGATVAAVSMAGPVCRILPHEERFGRRVAATALEISTVLGYLPRSNSQSMAALHEV